MMGLCVHCFVVYVVVTEEKHSFAGWWGYVCSVWLYML